MQAKIRFNGQELIIPNIIKAEGLKKFSGLMFKGKNSNAMLFSFSQPGKHAIHSLFCKDFLAIWLNQGRIVDYQLVNRVKLSIKPKQDFTHLIEIPLNEKYSGIISFFTGNSEKTL